MSATNAHLIPLLDCSRALISKGLVIILRLGKERSQKEAISSQTAHWQNQYAVYRRQDKNILVADNSGSIVQSSINRLLTCGDVGQGRTH